MATLKQNGRLYEVVDGKGRTRRFTSQDAAALYCDELNRKAQQRAQVLAANKPRRAEAVEGGY